MLKKANKIKQPSIWRKMSLWMVILLLTAFVVSWFAKFGRSQTNS